MIRLHDIYLLWLPVVFAACARAELVPVTLHVDESSPGRAIPDRFIGLSYEKNTLALDHFRSDNAAMVRLMRQLGGGVLRLGAKYVETTRWEPHGIKSFSNEESVIGIRELENLYGFARASDWPVIHGLNLGVNDPKMAASEATAALRIGNEALIAFEIGNEPEHYGSTWRTKDYSYADFRGEVARYLRVMRPESSRLPLAGPATTSNFPWFSNFIRDFKPDLVMTTRHNYPLSALSKDPADSRFGTIENLLSPSTAAQWRKLIGQHQKASEAAGLPFRVGEAGSASGGGKPGVSDVFASALWSADYLFDLAALGVAGVNFHGSFNCRGYTSFCASKHGGYHAHGNYYGMLFFRQSSQGRVVPVKHVAEGVNLTSHAVLGDDGTLRVSLINKDLRKGARVGMIISGRSGQASLMRLIAPSVDAKVGFTLGGSEVTSDGNWKPRPLESINAENGQFKVDVPAASAVLVVVAPVNIEPVSGEKNRSNEIK